MSVKPQTDLLRSEQASSLIEMAVLMPFLILLLLGAIDFGRGYYLASEVASAAHAGAVYAVQSAAFSSIDSSGTQAAAKADAPDVSNLVVATPTWGCECSDGGSYSASCATPPSGCSANYVYRVTVTATALYTPLFPWPGIPSSINLSGSSTMRAGGS